MNKPPIEPDQLLFQEKLSSNKTEALFLALMFLFLMLLTWRALAVGFDGLAGVFCGLFGIFLFYVVNYRTLLIRITEKALALTFGIFTWTVPLDNIADCQFDNLPPVMEFGGAGIHFMIIHKRYRASFNFLEYSRLVIAFKRKVGPVLDISFSTCRPEELLRFIQEKNRRIAPEKEL